MTLSILLRISSGILQNPSRSYWHITKSGSANVTRLYFPLFPIYRRKRDESCVTCSIAVEYFSDYERDKNLATKHFLLVEGLSLARNTIIRMNTETIGKLHANGVGYRHGKFNEPCFVSCINMHYSITNRSIKSSLYYEGCKFSEVVYQFRGIYSNKVISNYLNLLCSGGSESRVSKLILLTCRDRNEKFSSENFDYTKSKALFATLPQVTFQFKLLGLTKGGLELVCSSLCTLIEGFSTTIDISEHLDDSYCANSKDYHKVKLCPKPKEFFSKVGIDSSTVRSVSFSLIKRLSDTSNKPAQVVVYVIYLLLNLYLQQAKYLLENIQVVPENPATPKKAKKAQSKGVSGNHSTPKNGDEDDPVAVTS